MQADSWFWLLARSALALTFALIAVLSVRYWLREVLHPHARYGLWLAVPLALLGTQLSVPSAISDHGLVLQLTTQIAPSVQASVDPNQLAISPMFWNWLDSGLVIWFAGCLCLVAVYLRAYLRASDAARKGELSEIGVIGFIRPTVHLPRDFAERYSAEQQALILAHEQYHIFRNDTRINLFGALLHSVFWFHPLMPIALRAFADDQEMSCDAAIIARQPQELIPYAKALSQSLNIHGNFTVHCRWRTVHPLLERIQMLKSVSDRKLSKSLGLVICASLCLGITAITPLLAGANQSTLDSSPADGTKVLFGLHLKVDGVTQSMPAVMVSAGEDAEVHWQEPNGYRALHLRIRAVPATVGWTVRVASTVSQAQSESEENLELTVQERGSFAVSDASKQSLYEVDFAVKNHTKEPVGTFPVAACMLGITGDLMLRVELDAAGKVLQSEVISAEPANVFDRTALAMINAKNFGPQPLAAGATSRWVNAPVKTKCES